MVSVPARLEPGACGTGGEAVYRSAARAPLVEEARAAVQQAEAVTSDATGGRQEQRRAWRWTVVAAARTVCRSDRRRGGAVVEGLLGADSAGVVGSDRGSAYRRFPAEQRDRCGAHRKRDFPGLADRGGAAEPMGRWGRAATERRFALGHGFRAGACDREE